MTTDAGWELLAYIARERRDFLGLKQEEVALYGGPGKSTVGKIENARQRSFPPRTFTSLQKVYGWGHDAVANILAAPEQSWWDSFGRDGYAYDYIHAPRPDLEAMRDEASGTPRRGDDDENDWPALYGQALRFSLNVTREVPELQEQATAVLLATGRLFEALMGRSGRTLSERDRLELEEHDRRQDHAAGQAATRARHREREDSDLDAVDRDSGATG